jgi:hypothetical protein
MGQLHLTCSCLSSVEALPFLGPFVELGEIPRCGDCGSILKPDVILFGEQLPQSAWLQAQRDARQCDLMLVAGSSLEVLPVAGLPMQALDRGAHLIIVNNSTHLFECPCRRDNFSGGSFLPSQRKYSMAEIKTERLDGYRRLIDISASRLYPRPGCLLAHCSYAAEVSGSEAARCFSTMMRRGSCISGLHQYR